MMSAALSYYGTKEIAGKRHNPRIVRWLRAVIPGAYRDETPWCSAFMYAIASEVGVKLPTKTPARAISWKSIGPHATLDQVQQGDIVVLTRKSRHAWARHVGLYVRHSKNYIWLLGGNQGDTVTITRYRRSRIDAIIPPQPA